MKLMFPKKSFVGILLALFALGLVFTGSLSAQSKKKAAAKKAVAKKTERQLRDAKKDRDKAKIAARDNKRGKSSANDKKREAVSAKDKAKTLAKSKADAKSKKDPKKLAEARRAEAEHRRREEERRQAIIAEQRRREQAAREARARKLAFENGLRNETVANIMNDKTDGEDLQIRQAAINALGNKAGSVVVMEAQTGKVLTIVNQNWAVRGSIRPCSTIKLVTGAAGLNEGVISKENGSVRNTSTRRMLDDAIAFSDNSYFQRVGSNLGNTKLVEYGHRLGLGEPTGINLDGETPGRLPVSNNKARIYSHGDDTEVSTIQLAVMVSAITNGGHRVLPRIPRNSAEQARFQTFYKANVDLPQQNVRRMIPGMMGAAEYGTAHRGMNQSLGVAGKTGSCIDKGSWVGLFTSVAPIESPKYAVAVITRGQHERGKYAAAVAGQIYNALAGRIVRTDHNLAQTEFHLKPKNQIDVKTAETLADAEGDEAVDASGDENQTVMDSGGRRVIIVPSAPGRIEAAKPAPKKFITRTGDSKPLFPPVIITYDKDGKEIKNGKRAKPE